MRHKLAEMAEFEVPVGMVDLEFDAIWKQLQEEIQWSEGEAAGTSEDELKEEYRAIAERRVRLGLIRGLKGVVIGQLLVSIVGYGALFETPAPVPVQPCLENRQQIEPRHVIAPRHAVEIRPVAVLEVLPGARAR